MTSCVFDEHGVRGARMAAGIVPSVDAACAIRAAFAPSRPDLSPGMCASTG